MLSRQQAQSMSYRGDRVV